MTQTALRIDPTDDVVTVLSAVGAGDSVDVSDKAGNVVCKLVARQDVPRFHKLAVRDIPIHAEVHKYGCVIGQSTCAIEAGEYVHTHNLVSLRTGASQ